MMFEPLCSRRPARLLCLVGLLVGLLVLPSAATAQEDAPAPVQAAGGPKPRLFMIPTDSVRGEISPLVPERINETMRERLRADARVEMLPTYSEIQRRLGGGQHASAAVAEAERLYTSGIGLLTAAENQRAAETFQRAVDMMEQNIGDLHNFEVLADALVNLSLAYFQSGFDLDARKYMQKFAHVRPDATLDPEKFPEELLAVYKDEQDKVKKAGEGKLVITSNRPGAQVFIDGVAKGETPVTVEDVGFGVHYLVVRDTRGGTWSEEIRVRGRGREQSVEVDLGEGGAASAQATAPSDADGLPVFYTEIRDTLRTGAFGTDLQPYLRELATRTGAQYIGWVIMVKEGTSNIAAPFVYRASDGLFVQIDTTRFNMELSNLRVGVNRMVEGIIAAVETMPTDQAFTEVDLNPKREDVPAAVAVAPPVRVAAEAGPGEGAAVAPVPVPRPEVRRDDEIIAPPAVMPSEGRTWTYVGWGTAAVLVGGAIAGAVYFLAAGDTPTKAGGFNAEVSW